MIAWLTENQLFFILLTLAAYQAGSWCQRRLRSAFCSPLLVAAALIIAFLLAAGIPTESYRQGCAGFSWLLTPATVSLAIPLYTHIQTLKANWRAIAAGIAAGVGASLVSIWAMAALLQLDHTLYVSLLPKSITTAMGLAVSEMYGGVAGVTTAAIVITGIAGNSCGVWLCRLLHLTSPVAQGVALGVSSHVIGTARAAQLSAEAEAAGSLSLVVAGILTAVLLPLFVPLL